VFSLISNHLSGNGVNQDLGSGPSIAGSVIILNVFQPPLVVVILYLALYAIAGMAIGALSGWVISLITKCGPKGIVWDIFLGSFGFLAGFIGCIFMPWPTNTVVEHLDGGVTESSTMSRYQHPERVAIVMAVLLPLLHELYRLKRVQPPDNAKS
jgi:hypothetical protein